MSPEEFFWIVFTGICLALTLMETVDSRRDLLALEARYREVANTTPHLHHDSWDGCFLHRVEALRIAAKRNYRAATVRTLVMSIYVLVGVLAAKTAPPARPALELLSLFVAIAFIGSGFLLMLNSILDRRDRARLLDIFDREVEAKVGEEST